MKKVVKVEFLFEGCINENEIQNGVLFGNRVLVADKSGISLYNAYPSQTGEPNVVLVDLDADGCDYLNYHPELLLDLVTA